MNFLLLSQLPRVDESRAHYDAMLEMSERESRTAACWRRLRAAFGAIFR
jgi:hypothetical protein